MWSILTYIQQTLSKETIILLMEETTVGWKWCMNFIFVHEHMNVTSQSEKKSDGESV